MDFYGKFIFNLKLSFKKGREEYERMQEIWDDYKTNSNV